MALRHCAMSSPLVVVCYRLGARGEEIIHKSQRQMASAVELPLIMTRLNPKSTVHSASNSDPCSGDTIRLLDVDIVKLHLFSNKMYLP
jgi:hypothetical protein